MKKVTLGASDAIINYLQIFVADAETGKEKEIPLFDKDGSLERDAEGGFSIKMNQDELAQSIAYLRGDTDGKVGADDILKSMFKNSPDILGDDEPFLMGITILKELVKRTRPGTSENLALKCALASLQELI